jgi:hypothetical protein
MLGGGHREHPPLGLGNLARVVGFREVRAGPVLSVVMRVIEVALWAAVSVVYANFLFAAARPGASSRV